MSDLFAKFGLSSEPGKLEKTLMMASSLMLSLSTTVHGSDLNKRADKLRDVFIVSSELLDLAAVEISQKKTVPERKTEPERRQSFWFPLYVLSLVFGFGFYLGRFI